MRILFFALLFWSTVATQSTLPACDERPTALPLPRVERSLFCLERVIEDNAAGEMAFTAIAAAPDGTLYATRPLTGEVFAFTDTDNDGLPDTPTRIAEGLTLPNAMAFYGDMLYIAGGSHVYTLENDELTILIDDLPIGAGFWTGGIAVGNITEDADPRIYVGIGANCEYCVPDDARAVILSYALDGTDRQIFAEGLRQPSGLALYNGLWALDSAREDVPMRRFDELNRVDSGAHFGFPYCSGRRNNPDTLNDGFDCETATVPALVFPNPSMPTSVVAYTGAAFPHLNGQLLVTLGGSYNQSETRGFALIAVSFDPSGNPADYTFIAPTLGDTRRQIEDLVLSDYQLAEEGFYPHHVYGVATSPEGWIYISTGGGRIFALRPA